MIKIVGCITLTISVTDVQKLRRFILSDVDPSEVDKLGKDNPVDLMIRAVYGRVDCEELRSRKTMFDTNFISLYTYLIIAIHRVLFEHSGKCVKPLIDIANYLNPHTTNLSILLRFYERVYRALEKEERKREMELHEIYEEFKDYFSDDFKSLIAPKVIKVSLAYLGVRDIDIDDINFEDKSYVHYNSIDTPLEEIIEKLGLVGVMIEDEGALLDYYKKWFYKVKKDIENSRKSKRNLILEYVKKLYKSLRKT